VWGVGCGVGERGTCGRGAVILIVGGFYSENAIANGVFATNRPLLTPKLSNKALTLSTLAGLAGRRLGGIN